MQGAMYESLSDNAELELKVELIMDFETVIQECMKHSRKINRTPLCLLYRLVASK
ncbi:hypothetical protein ACTXT7_015661 [Hymenolepis weldensis]